MAAIKNEIEINAPIETIWEALTEVDMLDKYDPTIEKSIAITKAKSGNGAARKVTMKDGKNWFEETCTIFFEKQQLQYELTACSFPIHSLSHCYSFKQKGEAVIVRQEMNYTVKFGWFGKLLDRIIIRKQSDKGIKLFFHGLKQYAESGSKKAGVAM